jgi:hypothetical protein
MLQLPLRGEYLLDEPLAFGVYRVGFTGVDDLQ